MNDDENPTYFPEELTEQQRKRIMRDFGAAGRGFANAIVEDIKRDLREALAKLKNRNYRE